MRRTTPTSFDQAREAYRGTIATFARNCVYRLPSWSEEDVQQELLVVLWQCVEKYDPDKGASFNTLFQGCARNKIISLIRMAETKSRKADVVYLDQEAMRLTVEGMFTDGSAEDWYFALEDLSPKMVSEVVLGQVERASRRRSA